MSFYVVPQPRKFEILSDKNVFELSDSVNVVFPDEAKKAYDELSVFFKKLYGFEITGGSSQSIFLEISYDETRPEDYNLKVENDSVHIEAFGEAGALYAVETLKQLLLQSDRQLPSLLIEDGPELKWRGFMLDVSRYFFTVEAVKLFIDAMALHKLNVFHIHLTDDQGWRVEVYSKLLLAQIGAFRSHTNFGRTPHGGFFTKDDIAEIVNYAHSKCIKVVPEIDQPGHTVSAIAAYPELSCFDRELDVATHSGIKHDVLCVGKESTFDFMEKVLDEICEMFPDKIIHLGGDEVPTTRWEVCPRCKKRMEEEGFTEVRQLHTYYINRMASYLRKKGMEVIMWNDSSPESKADKDIIWQCWDDDIDDKGAETLMKSGRRLINSKLKGYYLDIPYGSISLEDCYGYNPLFTEEKDKNLMGAEACLWTEYVPDMKRAGYCTFPRLGAFCESVWTEKENRSFDIFMKKLPSYYRMIETIPFDYAKPKHCMPGFIRKHASKIWFERRQLHWQGLHNLIDNNKVKRQAQKEKEHD